MARAAIAAARCGSARLGVFPPRGARAPKLILRWLLVPLAFSPVIFTTQLVAPIAPVGAVVIVVAPGVVVPPVMLIAPVVVVAPVVNVAVAPIVVMPIGGVTAPVSMMVAVASRPIPIAIPVTTVPIAVGTVAIPVAVPIPICECR